VLVNRFDVTTLGNAERTPQGFLKIPAYLTRVGVLEYKRADGTVVRELRPPDEVLGAKSLATLSAAPVTDLHPTQMVGPKNVRQLQIGHVSDQVKADGKMVAAHVTIQEAEAIAAVEAGKRRELSCGYQCRIDTTPGVFEGQAYDQVQRDIVYNHVAIGPRNWGRAGRDVALRVDAADGGDETDVFRLDEADALSVAMVASPDDGGKRMEPVTIHVDGIDVKVVDKQGAQLVEKAIGTRDDALVEAVGDRDKLQGRVDQLEADLKKEKAARAAAEDPKRLDERVAARTALIDQAKRVLPADHKFDGLSVRQIQEAVLTAIDSKFEPKDRTDEYIGARFDQAMDERKDAKPEDNEHKSNLDEARRVTSPATKRASARADTKEAPVPQWMRPCSYTRARTTVVGNR